MTYHNIRHYTDVNGEWGIGNREWKTIRFNANEDMRIKYLKSIGYNITGCLVKILIFSFQSLIKLALNSHFRETIFFVHTQDDAQLGSREIFITYCLIIDFYHSLFPFPNSEGIINKKINS
jgi:hypothetical protein